MMKNLNIILLYQPHTERTLVTKSKSSTLVTHIFLCSVQLIKLGPHRPWNYIMQSTSNKLRLRENEEIQMHIFDMPNNSTEQKYELNMVSFSQYDTWLHFVSILSV